MRKTLFALLAVILSIGLAGGAFAYFTDTINSNNNTFTSGVPVIAISNGGPYVTDDSCVVATASDMAPGHSVGPFDVYFKNVGTMPGVVSVNLTYTSSPIMSPPPSGAPTNIARADAVLFAKKLIVSYAESDLAAGVNVAPYWARQVAESTGDGTWATAIASGFIVADSMPGLAYPYLPTVDGLKQVTLRFQNGYGGEDVPLAPGAVHYEFMTLKLDPSADNAYAWMGISITLTATLTSV